MTPRTCQRCGATFDRTRRDPSIWCHPCRGATAGDELTALIFPDRSGIHSLHEKVRDAFDAMKADAAHYAPETLRLVKVIGHAGAVSQVDRDDPEGEMWDRMERAWDNAEFERGVL